MDQYEHFHVCCQLICMTMTMTAAPSWCGMCWLPTACDFIRCCVSANGWSIAVATCRSSPNCSILLTTTLNTFSNLQPYLPHHTDSPYQCTATCLHGCAWQLSIKKCDDDDDDDAFIIRMINIGLSRFDSLPATFSHGGGQLTIGLSEILHFNAYLMYRLATIKNHHYMALKTTIFSH